MPHKELDQTLVLIKPDALKNSLTGYVLSLLSEYHTQLRFAGLKVVHVSRMLAEEHYAEHRDKVFFPVLVEYIRGRLHYPDQPHKQRVIAIVYQGPDAVQTVREVCGPTNPLEAREQKPGCIRSLGTLVPIKNADGVVIGQRMDNLIHASATPEEAEREIKLWFKPNEIPPFMRVYATHQSDRHFYYHNDRLLAEYAPGSICLLAPGDVAWESDWQSLQAVFATQTPSTPLRSVVAKYLTNETAEE